MRICAPVLQAYELVLRPKLQKLQSELVRIKNQESSPCVGLRDILYDRLVPVSDAQMLAHSTQGLDRGIFRLACRPWLLRRQYCDLLGTPVFTDDLGRARPATRFIL